MARPKTGKPPKRNLNLTVDEQTKAQLDLISQHRQMSISALVAMWADCEAKAIQEHEKDRADRALKNVHILRDFIDKEQEE